MLGWLTLHCHTLKDDWFRILDMLFCTSQMSGKPTCRLGIFLIFGLMPFILCTMDAEKKLVRSERPQCGTKRSRLEAKSGQREGTKEPFFT